MSAENLERLKYSPYYVDQKYQKCQNRKSKIEATEFACRKDCFIKFLDAIQHAFGFIDGRIDVEIEEIMEMRLRRHAKGDGPWEEEQDFQFPDASGGSSYRRETRSVKSTTQVRPYRK